MDILFQSGRELVAIEAKASATYTASLLKGLKKMASVAPAVTHSYLVYAGEACEFSDSITALKYDEVSRIFFDNFGDLAVRHFTPAYGGPELELPEREITRPMEFPE